MNLDNEIDKIKIKIQKEWDKTKYKYFSLSPEGQRERYHIHKHKYLILHAQKNTCECGKVYTRTHKQRHLNSKYHKNRTEIKN